MTPRMADAIFLPGFRLPHSAQSGNVSAFMKIVVTAKQVIDPDMPASAFTVDRDNRRVVTPSTTPPVVNGFDENAVEAALQIKDELDDVTVTVVSMGTSFSLDVLKKPLAMGANELVLLQDEAFENTADSLFTARVLAAAIQKIGAFDLIICGRQASDWDNAQVPLGIAELLGLPCITTGKKVQVGDGKVTVERIAPDGYQVLEATLPALVTVSNELGMPRYPTLRGIMAASRMTPVTMSLEEIGIDPASYEPGISLEDLFVPVSEKVCELITGETEEEAGRNLAMKLREAKLI